MRKRSNKTTDKNKRLDPAIVVALIGLAGTIIAALLASPLLERLFSAGPTPSATSAQGLNGITTPDSGNRIGLNQTVQGTLYFDEAGVWIFDEGPATVTMVLDVGPFGSALLIVRDPSGVERAYVEEQSPGVARLVNFSIPTDGDYTILVRNAANEQVDYTLSVQDVLTPPPP
jgi:hypothetical protein